MESTLRDGFHLEYFGVMLEDATHQAGPDYVQKAAVFNIETFFGWVSSTADFRRAFAPDSTPPRKPEDPMTDRAIIPPGTHPPLAPYSPGMMADGVIYVSGTLAFDKNNDVVHVGDAAAQTRHILETIQSVLTCRRRHDGRCHLQLHLRNRLGQLRRRQ